jgi:hypothetical protein
MKEPFFEDKEKTGDIRKIDTAQQIISMIL